MKQTQGGMPDLDRYLGDRKRTFITYEDGARIYAVPYWTFARLAMRAGANYETQRRSMVDLGIVRQYVAAHPEEKERLRRARARMR